jgi:hypothetical protein
LTSRSFFVPNTFARMASTIMEGLVRREPQLSFYPVRDDGSAGDLLVPPG